MKPFIQKLPLDEASSFVAKTFRTPHFEVGWHQHIEYELILFTEGSGMSFIGNHVGEFETGDIYFLGSNLPHTFQKSGEQITSAIVVQFRDDLFIRVPETRAIHSLFQTAIHGLKIHGATRLQLAPLVKELETATGFRRILILSQCLEMICANKEFTEVSTQEVRALNPKDKDCIDRIFQFTIDSFKEPVSLAQVAGIACMSIPAFCNYFKRSTKKTYIDFLNEVRIGYACNLLMETKKPVLDICYESGYNTMANFHKQFLKVKGLTPLQYRKSFAADVIKKGNNIGIVGDVAFNI
jgi:AraC-like DNA-binding protein